MKRLALIALVALVAPIAPAFADVTVKSTVTGKGMGMSQNTTSTTFLKGNKMRVDTVVGDTTATSIFDLDTQKLYSFDSKKKEADVFDMQKLAADVEKSVTISDMKTSLTPNGKTKEIAGKSATGYDMTISLPATFGGAGGMKVTMNLAGPVWVVKGAPGADEYNKFFTTAVDKGWFFTDTRAAKAQPGQAKAFAEMYRQMAATGGIAYETEMNVKMSGDGPMAGMLAKAGNISMMTTVTSVDTGAIAADMFAVPAGYKLKEQK